MKYTVEIRRGNDNPREWYWRVDDGKEYLHDGFARFRWLACWRVLVTLIDNTPWRP